MAIQFGVKKEGSSTQFGASILAPRYKQGDLHQVMDYDKFREQGYSGTPPMKDIAYEQDDPSPYRTAIVSMAPASVDMHFRQQQEGVQAPNQWRADQSNAYVGNDHGRGTLFSTSPAEITSAFSDPKLRAAVPTLMSMALNEGRKQGYGVTHSDSLSKFSSPLTKRALKMGLIQHNPENFTAKRTNDIGDGGVHEQRAASYQMDAFEPAPDEMIQAARETKRSIVQGMHGAESQTPQETWLNADPDRPHSTHGQGQGTLRLGAQFGANYQENKQGSLFSATPYTEKQEKAPKEEKYHPEINRWNNRPNGYEVPVRMNPIEPRRWSRQRHQARRYNPSLDPPPPSPQLPLGNTWERATAWSHY